ncbi:cilia- and flagella-associated protein 46 isoform X4 [Takifugu flavidus]|uniref:cilia- and flagella-associated protein 46 isoform X4 n=1 Tax=Takifugu flavidus TaxID=433684 RepID=UPI00254456E4|nr:cilia- and flagella-associated protein 46 isoform X4 [Takifugu flavidus]
MLSDNSAGNNNSSIIEAFGLESLHQSESPTMGSDPRNQPDHSETSNVCLKMFSEEILPADQLLSEAHLCQGQLWTPLATGNMKDFEETIRRFLKDIETSKAEHPRFHYKVFNSSVRYFHAVRPFLQPGRCQHLVPSLREVIQSLEEVDDRDHSWRAELMMHLITCLVDSGDKTEAASFAKVTETFIKAHIPRRFSRLFMLLVHHKLAETDTLTELSSQSAELSAIYKIQQVKNRLEETPESDLKQELEEILQLLVGHAKDSSTHLSSIPAPFEPTDRAAFLLELALLALHVKHQKVAASCLKELKSVGEASVGQQIIMECVNSEINLLKRDAMMNVYCRASIEARLKEITKLDQCLQTATREGDPQAMQAVCATQWTICLPLLQPKFRKYIRTPLLNVAIVLEEIQSVFVEMRCQLHSELAAIEEEKGSLEASLTHLQKALLLDDGTQQEHLSSAVHLLQLRTALDQTPSRREDKAAQLLQKVRDLHPKDETDIRPTLVSVGLLLAPDEFQMVLDADNIPESCPESGPAAQLGEKAAHHSASVCKVDGHLDRRGEDADSTERVKLWATLVKTAAKHEVWDVCRAACRFCLLYDDGRWTPVTKTDNYATSANATPRSGSSSSQIYQNDVPRLLAEVHFINAEATVKKLLSEGVHLNAAAVPPVVENELVSIEDPLWVAYSDWIQELSAYATSSLLRAARIGTEIEELWVVENAAVYLWNYNSPLLAAGEYQRLLPVFQTVVELLQKTDNNGHHVLFVLLCDAVARGIIQSLTGPDQSEPALPADEGKKRARKEPKISKSPRESLDAAAGRDVLKALQLCEEALRVSSTAGNTVPMAVQKQLVATWVELKQLLRQQIGSTMDAVHKCENEDVSAMTRVLVGVEMLRCNRTPRQMEFKVPSLSSLVNMTSECSWSDALVELQVWCQLAAFCYEAEEHSLLLRSIENALMLQEAAAKSLIRAPFVLFGLTAVSELLSIVVSLKGLLSIHTPCGDVQAYKEAMKEFLSSVSYAEQAENPHLCVTAATHFWNTCLPFIHIPDERRQLLEPLGKILLALIQTRTKQLNQSTREASLSLKAVAHGDSLDDAMDQQNLNLRAAIYHVLLHHQMDKADWKGALELLDSAVRDTPCSRQQLLLQRHRVLVKARLGESIITDVRKLQKGGETNCTSLWHQAALSAVNVTQQLAYYKHSITSPMSAETRWQKVIILLEFGEWLYRQSFPEDDGQLQVHKAIDILLQKESDQTAEADDKSPPKDLVSLKCDSVEGFKDLLFTQSLAEPMDVRCLDGLVRAHVLLAVMSKRTSPEHQLNLLRASTFVLQIWQVSMATHSHAAIKKGQDSSQKPRGKKANNPPSAKDKSDAAVGAQPLPSSPEDWAQYVCPDQARQIFRTSTDPCCINTHSITNQTRSLFFLSLLQEELQSLSLGHLTLPILHLAEAIASDLLDCRSLSDLYGLRIVQTCCQMGLEKSCPYQDKVINMAGICEQELMACRKAVVLEQQRRGFYDKDLSEDSMNNSGLQKKNVNIKDIWLDKAVVCVSMGLYQAARELLSEAHLASVELREDKTLAKTLLSQARLACAEHNFDQALNLLAKAQELGGDENFWYQLTLTLIRAVAGQREMDAHIQIDQITNQGCEALELVLKQQLNRVPEIRFLITSLQMRGTVESVRVLGIDDPGETLSTKVVQRLTAAYETLRECAGVFAQLSYREHAAEAHKECAYILRGLADNTTDVEGKQHFLLEGLSQLQLAVSQQEHVVLNAQALLPSESAGLSLESVKQLQHLRLALADFSLAMLGEHCAEKTRQAVARERMSAAEIALEEFLRSTPEPDSTKEKWINVGMTLEQVALGQLTAIYSQSQDNETNAHRLLLRGKYFRMLAVQEDPLCLYALWDKQPCSDPEVSSMERRHSKEDTAKVSARGEPSVTSGKHVELQQQTSTALLSSAHQALAEAITLCLQHKLPTAILADAALTMAGCHGQGDPVLAGQHLALFQSCCAAATVADVLCRACADSSTSQLSALLNLHSNVLVSQKERASRMLKEVEDSLNKLSKSSALLTISPNHLDILANLPPNLKLLLLQHSQDGSEIYGAFYEADADPDQIGKKLKDTGTLACSRVAKVSVCPQALRALREQSLAFSHEKRQALHQKAAWLTDDQDQSRAIEDTIETSFRLVVQHMEEYLSPLLSQLNFSFSRPQDGSSASPELTKTGEKERKSPVKEAEQYVVVLADTQLLDLPLEALSILQDDRLCSVSRDFSLQLLHSRLPAHPGKVTVASDNKKETKREKKTTASKKKGNQSQVIKETPQQVPPSHAFPVDTRNFKYIVDPNNEGAFEDTSLSMWMQQILEKHNQLTNPWKGFLGSQQKPSLSEMEQLLCTCSGFLYVGMESMVANIPPATLAALNMSECRVALLFDLMANPSRIRCPSAFTEGASDTPAVLKRPSETALLLSLCGVGCVVLHQWPSSLPERTQCVDSVLDYLLRARHTCGQSVHTLRRGTASDAPHHKPTFDEVPITDSKEDDGLPETAFKSSAFNCVLYGLPNLSV